MNIAFLTSEYPHPKIANSAGIGTSIKNLALALVSKGHKVTIFVYSENCEAVFQEKNITIHKIAYKKYPMFSWFFYRKKIQNYINAIIKKDAIDLIEAPDWTGITAFMKFKCPLVIRMHGTDAYFCSLEGRKQKVKNYIFEKIALKSANHIVSVSEFTAIKTKKIFKLKNDITVIHNGIDTQYFSPSLEKVEPNTILYFGSIIRKKGVLELASIFNEVTKRNTKAKLILIGHDVKDILEQKSTRTLFEQKLTIQAKNNVQFIEKVTYYKIKDYISKSSVVVLPSFAEAFPMTWLEAMAMGKALVTSNIGWANELMVIEETGFMISPSNHKKYAEKINKLLADAKLNSKFGTNARERIEENFSNQIIVEKNIKFYQSILKK
ncbi:MAG: glycosyl transferase [Flavobacteriaceae bacterium]|nr:MAG: glycosyl transferase [Flavobacteriaceae bacterium]